MELSRRKAILAGGGLAALGALVATSPARARELVGWDFSPTRSVAGSGAGTDPHWVWDDEADPLMASMLERGLAPKINELLWGWERNDQPLPAGLPPFGDP